MKEQKQRSRRDQISGTVMESGTCDKRKELRVTEVNGAGVRVPEAMRRGIDCWGEELGVGERSRITSSRGALSLRHLHEHPGGAAGL